ncbi:MAG: MFS transporter [Patescibacteria group bacterium]|nr:MFS transporter [Patescibacteria group bacterium]
MLDNVNRVVKYLVLSDLLLFVGWGFVSPIFAVFVLENIAGATLVTAGIAGGIYWFFRAIVQPFVAKVLDKTKGEKDDFFALVGSLLAVGVISFWLALVKTPEMLYLAQIFHGAALGVYSVAWPAIFTRHIDKGRVAFDWSLDNGSIGLAVAIASIVGAKVAEVLGFEMVFVLAGIGSIISAVVLLAIPKLILPQPKEDSDKVYKVRTHRKQKARSTVGP